MIGLIAAAALAALALSGKKKDGKSAPGGAAKALEKLSKPQRFARLILAIEKATGGKVITTSYIRTYEEQAKLYQENPKNAAPGHSKHESGDAMDINVILPNGMQLKKSSPAQDWINSGVIDVAKKLGFKWGGDKFKGYYDPVHFEISDDGQ